MNTNEGSRLVCEFLGSEAICHLLLVTETSLYSSLTPPQDKAKENTVTPGRLLYMNLQNVMHTKSQSLSIYSNVPHQWRQFCSKHTLLAVHKDPWNYFCDLANREVSLSLELVSLKVLLWWQT